MFRSYLLSIIRSLNTVFTTIGIKTPDDGTVNLSESCRVLYKIKLTNSASCWHLLHQHLCRSHNVDITLGNTTVIICYVQVAAVPVLTADFVPCVCMSRCSPNCTHKPRQTFLVQVKARNMKSPCKVFRITNTYHTSANKQTDKQITQGTATSVINL